MNLLVDIGHPGHVHFFKNAIFRWRAKKHRVVITTRCISVAEHLLKTLELDYWVVSKKRTGYAGLSIELIEHTGRLLKVMVKNNIDVAVSIGGTFMVYAAKMTGCKSIVFSDSETHRIANGITFPLANFIVTPEYYTLSLGRKQLRYAGCHELAYLHPDVFTPNPEIPAKYGLADTPFCIVRFCAWEAAHDIDAEGLTLDQKHAILKELSGRYRIAISVESEDNRAFRDLTISFSPEDFHDLIYYADYCVTEGATTAVEACILGTPSMYLNPSQGLGTLRKLSSCGLIEMILPDGRVLSRLEASLKQLKDREYYRKIARDIVASHCDVTDYMVNLVEKIAISKVNTE